MLTRATVPLGLPQAPRIPVCNLSAPAHDNILLIRTTWYGCARTRRWKLSLPPTLTRYLYQNVSTAVKHVAVGKRMIERWTVPFKGVYSTGSTLPRNQTNVITECKTHLLAQIRAASRASELNCSYSLETKWTQRGNSSTPARFRPRSKMRILGSGTPRLNRDFGYGWKRVSSKF